MKAKILLIYPTPFKITGLPIGLASLCSVLKNNGHQVRIFDTAFYGSKEEISQTKIRSQRMISKKVEDEDEYLPINDSTMEEDLVSLINDYKPDLIGLSILEIVYQTSLEITRLIKKRFKHIPIVAGGVFPTLSAELVINESSIDMVCLGEGETALAALCNRIKGNKSFVDIEGLWVKSKGKVYKNRPSPLHNIDALPYPDFTEFNQRLFYKPMQGKMYKMVNISTSRGCPFSCSFCAAPQLREFFTEHGSSQYYRNMSMDKIIDQIYFQIQRHNPEFIYFSSENFLSMKESEFSLFIAEYKKIKLPFWFQTRVETIAKKRLSELKRVGMHWLSIGLEHGNEQFRKKTLKRNYSNKMFIEKMEILRELDIGASINNMIGFPFETRALIFDTIKMNRELRQRNSKLEINVFLFTPFRGCRLYNVCRKNGMLEDAVSISASDMSERSVINFPEEFQKNLMGLIRAFNLYVRLPEEDYDRIKIAEQRNAEGDLMLKDLRSMIALKE